MLYKVIIGIFSIEQFVFYVDICCNKNVNFVGVPNILKFGGKSLRKFKEVKL